MRLAIVIAATLLLAACDRGPKWVNEQAELANEANGVAPVVANESLTAETDYLNAADAAANDLTATDAAANDVNAASPVANNEAEPPPEGD